MNDRMSGLLRGLSQDLVLARAMFRLPIQQIQSMGQHRQRGAQRTDGPRRTPRHIQNHRGPQRSADRPAQTRQRRLLPPFRPHQFRNAFQQTLANRPRRLRGYIPRANPGSPGGNHQSGHATRLPDCVFDGLSLVWNRNAVYRLEVICVQRTGDRGTGKVLAPTSGRRVTDGDYRGSPARRAGRLVGHVSIVQTAVKSPDLMRK
jgi:hypothetical protein